MIKRFLILAFLFPVNVTPGRGETTIEPGQFVAFCEEATVLLNDGTRFQGAVMRIDEDGLWIEVSERVNSEPESLSASSSRRFWGSGPAVETRSVEPCPTSRVVRLDIRDIQMVTCGDPINDGALSGLVAGILVGGVSGLAAAGIEEGPGILVIPIAIGFVAAPTTILGAIADQSKGGRERVFYRDHLHRIVGVSEGIEGAEVIRHPSYHGVANLYLGPFYKRTRLPESDAGGLNMVGGRLIWLAPSEISFEPFLAYGEYGGEHWTNLGLALCLNAFNPEPISLFGDIGFDYYHRDVAGKGGGFVVNPDDRHFFALAFGGGLMLREMDDRLFFRSGFSFRFPFFDVAPYEIMVGGYFRL